MITAIRKFFGSGGEPQGPPSYDDLFLKLRGSVEDDIRLLEEMFLSQRIDAETHAALAIMKARELMATDPYKAAAYLTIAKIQRTTAAAIVEQQHAAMIDDTEFVAQLESLVSGTVKQIEATAPSKTSARAKLEQYRVRPEPEAPKEQPKPRFDSDYAPPKPSANGTGHK